MQYYTLLSVLAGAAAVSAGITDELLGSSLTGSAAGDADAQAKGGLSGLPTDDLLASEPESFTKKDSEASASDEEKEAPSKGGFLDSLGLKQMLKPTGYPYEDPAKTTYYSVKPTPTPTFITRTVTKEHEIPTVTAIPSNNNTSVNNGGVTSCSEGTATSCCDTKAASDGLLSNILGGSCALSNLNIPVLAVGGLSGSQCNNGNTFCCPVNQDVSIAYRMDH